MTLILVADDDFAILELVQTLLQEEGFQTIGVRNGREALAALAADRPGLVLSDLMMPSMDGRQLFQVMQAEPSWRDIPFVLMTAVVPAAQRHGLAYSAVIAKPFSLDTLLATVRNILAERPEDGRTPG